MKFLCMIVTLTCFCVPASAYFRLSGQLAEITGLPINLYCPQKLGYVSVGGITVNNVPLTPEKQSNAKDQCEKQMKKYEEYRTKPHKIPDNMNGTSCVMTLPGSKVGDDDIIRIVFNCYSQKPSGSPSWGKEEGNEEEEEGASEKVTEVTYANFDKMILSCKNKNAFISVTECKVDGTNDPQRAQDITEKCFRTIADKVKQGKQEVSCQMYNVYGTLDLKYACRNPGQTKAVKSNKKQR